MEFWWNKKGRKAESTEQSRTTAIVEEESRTNTDFLKKYCFLRFLMLQMFYFYKQSLTITPPDLMCDNFLVVNIRDQLRPT